MILASMCPLKISLLLCIISFIYKTTCEENSTLPKTSQQNTSDYFDIDIDDPDLAQLDILLGDNINEKLDDYFNDLQDDFIDEEDDDESEDDDDEDDGEDNDDYLEDSEIKEILDLIDEICKSDGPAAKNRKDIVNQEKKQTSTIETMNFTDLTTDVDPTKFPTRVNREDNKSTDTTKEVIRIEKTEEKLKNRQPEPDTITRAAKIKKIEESRMVTEPSRFARTTISPPRITTVSQAPKERSATKPRYKKGAILPPDVTKRKPDEFLRDQQTYRKVMEAYDSLFGDLKPSDGAAPESSLNRAPKGEIEQNLEKIERSPFHT